MSKQFKNIDEATEEAVCREVNRLYDAVERGEAEPLDFRDSCRPNDGWSSTQVRAANQRAVSKIDVSNAPKDF